MRDETVHDNNIDDWIDDTLAECLNIEAPKCFFLFAGAGSGKTRSLVNTLKQVWLKHGKYLRLHNKQIAVITYTNAASDEIVERLKKEIIDVSLFEVSTIHSFAWKIIQDCTSDIKNWLQINIARKIEEWEDLEIRGRKGTDASRKRINNIEKGKERLNRLSSIKRFKYDPNGDNIDKNSLQHEEVISICASFIGEKALFQKVVIQKYPIILIDESQDTKKGLIEALLILEENQQTQFSLGLFGDMMQRIYMDGKDDLVKAIPARWEMLDKKMNHRSQKRIIDLINKIRFDIDSIEQKPRLEKNAGIVRLFILPTSISDKEVAEKKVKEKMAEITQDNLWIDPNHNSVKSLILEHHMAAARLQFNSLFKSLNAVEKYRTSLKDGTLKSLNFFVKDILPIVAAHKDKDKLLITKIVSARSPLLSKMSLREYDGVQIDLLKDVNAKVNQLLKLWDDEDIPTLREVLLCIFNTGLFEIPYPLQEIAEEITSDLVDKIEEIDDRKIVDEDLVFINAWKNTLECTFDEVANYHKYISDQSQFTTHQGVKGLEYDRVVGILSDDEAQGDFFSYEKLFEVKDLTLTDKKNIENKKDSSIDRAKRLFYVICSRAKESLAIVAYTEDIHKLKEVAIKNRWFSDEEVLFKEDII